MRCKRVRKYHSGGTRRGYYTHTTQLDVSRDAKLISKAVTSAFVKGMCDNASKSEEQRKRNDELFFSASFKILAWLVPLTAIILWLCYYVEC